MKRIFALLLFVCMTLCLAACGESTDLQDGNNITLSAEEIYKKISPSVVEISGESSKGTSTGTGFFYDAQGTIITNYHVIENCTSATITLTSGASFSVKQVLGCNKKRDIAILSTNCKISVPLKIRTTKVNTGETVYAIGSSLGLSGSLSDGIISTAERKVEEEIYIQTTAPISKGNSGGPLIDKSGNVIGITSASFLEGQNLNLAIPITDVSNISTSSPKTLYELFGKNKNEQTFEEWSDEKKESATKPTQYTCSESNCSNIVDKSGEYCSEHKCTTVGCSNKKGTNNLYCHWCTCSEAYCANPRKDNGLYCVQHTCDSKNCSTKKTNNSNYCSSHECYETMCHNERTETGSYCVEHTCKSNGCSYNKEISDNFCWNHSCSVAGCKKESLGGLISYCTDHACASEGCLSRKSSNSDYCNSHDCYLATCHNEIKYLSIYCPDHACSYGSCTVQRERGSEFCYFHH